LSPRGGSFLQFMRGIAEEPVKQSGLFSGDVSRFETNGFSVQMLSLPLDTGGYSTGALSGSPGRQESAEDKDHGGRNQ
jgi:hypothetical protein